jgi:hypothetical protein
LVDRTALLQTIAGHSLALRRYEMVLPSLEEVFVELIGNNQETG